MGEKDVGPAKRLFSEIFYGVTSFGRSDPGMAGSLLYHMAMVTKMETENRLLVEEFKSDVPEITAELKPLYGTFISDVEELTKTILNESVDWHEVVFREPLSSDIKIQLFEALNESAKAAKNGLNN
jgi:hypothetical protein